MYAVLLHKYGIEIREALHEDLGNPFQIFSTDPFILMSNYHVSFFIIVLFVSLDLPRTGRSSLAS